MKLVRYGAQGEERPAILDDQGFLRDLSEHVDDIGPVTLAAAQLAELAALDVHSLPIVKGDNFRLGSPVGFIGKIVCIGLNYTDHAAEVQLPLPSEPTIFMKGCHATGPYDPVRLPRGSEKGDWEVELGIVIGKPGLYISQNAPIKWTVAGSGPKERAFQALHR
jgi:2-keto-4-pentenoate hydratase/2-oxohepta-3-ene-1,7-dioic acid hydratase in catechol pathway